jgi:hypothetical protein
VMPPWFGGGILSAEWRSRPRSASCGGSMSMPSRENALDHVVVVMFENRSFDNLLGRLYEPGEVASFEGVLDKDLSNPIPSWAEHGADPGVVPYGVAPNMAPPEPRCQHRICAAPGLSVVARSRLRRRPTRRGRPRRSGTTGRHRRVCAEALARRTCPSAASNVAIAPAPTADQPDVTSVLRTLSSSRRRCGHGGRTRSD